MKKPRPVAHEAVPRKAGSGKTGHRSRASAGKPADLLCRERTAWSQGCGRVAGVDEAGRGPLAGPVVAAAVLLPPAATQWIECDLAGLTDSKQLTVAARERFFAALYALPGIEIGIGLCSPKEIDDLNILRATHRAMARAVEALPASPLLALVDGLPVKGLPCPHEAIVGGDRRCLSIAAASVIAKVTRDRIMEKLDRACPGYGFARHKGYATRAHLAQLHQRGPSPHHRRSFAPVAACVLRQLPLL